MGGARRAPARPRGPRARRPAPTRETRRRAEPLVLFAVMHRMRGVKHSGEIFLFILRTVAQFANHHTFSGKRDGG